MCKMQDGCGYGNQPSLGPAANQPPATNLLYYYLGRETQLIRLRLDAELVARTKYMRRKEWDACMGGLRPQVVFEGFVRLLLTLTLDLGESERGDEERYSFSFCEVQIPVRDLHLRFIISTEQS